MFWNGGSFQNYALKHGFYTCLSKKEYCDKRHYYFGTFKFHIKLPKTRLKSCTMNLLFI